LLCIALLEGGEVLGRNWQGFAEIISILISASCLGTFAVCHPMFILRRFAGWRLDVPLRLNAPRPRPSIEGILWSTGGIACLLGLARLPGLAEQSPLDRFGPNGITIMLYTVIPLAVVAWLLPFMLRIAFADRGDADAGLAMVTWMVGFFSLLFLFVAALIIISGIFGSAATAGGEFGYLIMSFLAMSGAFAFGTYTARVGGLRFGIAARASKVATATNTSQPDVFDDPSEEVENITSAGSSADRDWIRSLRFGGLSLILLTAASTVLISQMTASVRHETAARERLSREIRAAGGGWSWNHQRKWESLELAGSLRDEQVGFLADHTLEGLGFGNVELSATAASILLRSTNLEWLSVRSDAVSMETILQAAGHLRRLRRLDLRGASFTLKQLNDLIVQLPQLRYLDLSGCKLEVDQIASLEVAGLSHLRLRGMNLSDEQAGQLMDAMPTVHSWDLSDNPLRGTFLKDRHCHRIWLDNTGFDDQAASQMQLKEPMLLSVVGTPLTGKGLARIAPSLASLRVGQGSINESDLAALGNTNLLSLALCGPEFTGARLQNWKGWSTITTLDLSGSGYTDAQRGIFETATGLKQLSLAGTAASSATLSVIPQFIELDIRGTSIPSSAVYNAQRLYVSDLADIDRYETGYHFPIPYSVNVAPRWLEFAGMEY